MAKTGRVGSISLHAIAVFRRTLFPFLQPHEVTLAAPRGNKNASDCDKCDICDS